MTIQWPLAIFTLLAGCGGWLLVWIGVNEFTDKVNDPKLRFKELITVIVLAVAGGISSSMHLTHVDRMMGALSRPASAIFTEAVMVGLITLLCIIYLVMAKREASKGTLKVLAAIGIVFGVVISYATGAGYMMSSQPNWATILMPIGYMTTAAAAGTALYLLFVAISKGDNKADALKFSGTCALIAGIVAAVVATIYGAVQGVFGIANALSLYLVCLVGCLGVALCGFLASKREQQTLAVVAVIFGVAASLGFRCFMFVCGTGLITLISNADGVLHFFGTI